MAVAEKLNNNIAQQRKNGFSSKSSFLFFFYLFAAVYILGMEINVANCYDSINQTVFILQCLILEMVKP